MRGARYEGIIIAADVRAGELDELPIAGAVSAEDLERARGFVGEYEFVGGQKERDGISEAIETSVGALNSMIRGLARKRLTAANPAPKNLSIALDDDAVTITIDGHGHTMVLGGAAKKTKSREGEAVKVSLRMRGDELVELVDGSGGDRRYRLKLSGDGKRLTLKVEISSSQLPVPVEYSLTFKRK